VAQLRATNPRQPLMNESGDDEAFRVPKNKNKLNKK
jgi:hypothetical protein